MNSFALAASWARRELRGGLSGFRIFFACLVLGVMAIAGVDSLADAMLAGMAQASCDLAVSYAKVREQFGQPIGAFQAIKHMCADMALRTTAAEAQVKMAAVFADAHTPGGDRQLDAAALIALKAARENAADAIQVHGGIGFTAECDAHFFLKRAYVLSALLGGLDGCRNRVLTAAGTPA